MIALNYSVEEIPPHCRVYVCRGHPAGGRYGDPYTYVCTLVYDTRTNRLYIKGALGEMEGRDAVRKVLDWAVDNIPEITEVSWDRHKGDSTKSQVIPVDRSK